MMNTICRRTLVHALFASFAITAISGHTAETGDTYAAASDSANLVELCASSPNGMVPKARVVKALHRMLDMGDTPRAAQMSKDDRRKMQFDVFWKEVARESEGG